MQSWHKRARLAVALFGAAVAAIVYLGVRERVVAPPPAPVERVDPKAIAETVGAIMQRVTGEETDFEVDAELQQLYEDGSMKWTDIRRISFRAGGRTVAVSAREGRSGPGQKEVEVVGDVALATSDGFALSTDRLTYNVDDSLAQAPGAVTFSRERMSGSGTGISYDQAGDVLAIGQDAHITMADEAGNPAMVLDAGSAVLDRLQDRLMLENAVHVVRGEQVIDSDHALARLTADENAVTFLELRGNARVAGGGQAIDAMSARDIDLDYTDDGGVLERVVLVQGAGITMIADDGGSGRQILGEHLDLALAPDGSLTRAVGKQDVRLDLAAGPQAPARSIRADALDATGEAGRGLTEALFTGSVVFTEQPRGTTPRRVVRARQLEAGMAGDAVTTATFTGGVTFEEPGMTAGAARLQYAPGTGAIVLRGRDAGGGPRVADQQVSIEADAIDLTLAGPRMVATGSVKSTLRPPTAKTGTTRLPGLLQQNAAANATAGALDYDGGSGRAVYTGQAALWQAETAVHAERITLDQSTGDLTAAGSARSTIALDGSTSVGSAAEIRYVDARRELTYAAAAAAPGAAAPAGAATTAQVAGPQGDLRARWIQIALAAERAEVRAIEARTGVVLQSPTRTVSGGDRLTYDAASDTYVVAASGQTPVTLLERDGRLCRPYTGKTLTFSGSTASIVIDGEQERRTEVAKSGPCPAAAAP